MRLITNTDGQTADLAWADQMGQADRIVCVVPFFSYPDLLCRAVREGREVELFVRLKFPTSPDAIRTLLNADDGDLLKVWVSAKALHAKISLFFQDDRLFGNLRGFDGSQRGRFRSRRNAAEVFL